MSFADDIKKLQGLAVKQYREQDFKGSNLIAFNDEARRTAEQVNSIILVMKALSAEIDARFAALPASSTITLVTVKATESPDTVRTLFTFPGTPIAVFLNKQLAFPIVEYTQSGTGISFLAAPGISDTIYAMVRNDS